MYHIVSVGKLSETQKSRLRNGHATRIKKGNGNKLHLTAEQIKEFVFEGKRWYDARRMKFGAEPLAFISASHPYGVLNKATHAYRLLWPIEPAIWTNDPLVNQTPGYVTSKPK